jgi:trk system potassium uptake protein TrkA
VFVIIAGSGKLGIGLARALSSRKDDVVVVDRGLESGCLGEGFDGVIVDGDPLDMEVLERSGTRRAELFIAVTADDNVNAACAQAARELFGVRTALARISDPEREAFYRGLGLGTVCPTTTGINQVLELILQDRFIPLARTSTPPCSAFMPCRNGWVCPFRRSSPLERSASSEWSETDTWPGFLVAKWCIPMTPSSLPL